MYYQASGNMSPKAQRRGGCCYSCCGTCLRAVCCTVWTVVCLAVVIFLLCFFLIPRTPSFCFTTGLPTNLTVTSGSGGLLSSGLQTTIPLNISIDNPNYIGLTLENTNLGLLYNDTITGLTLLATDTAQVLAIKRRGNSTLVTSVVFDSSASTSASEADILRDCTLYKNTTLFITADADLPVFHHKFHIHVPPIAIVVPCAAGVPGSASITPSSLLANSSSVNSYYCSSS